jgi:F-type H+-transporting ATPase subunit delta
LIDYDLAHRYAKVACRLASHTGRQQQWLEELQILGDLLTSKPHLMRYFSAPEGLAPHKRQVIEKSLGGDIDPALLDFLLYLVQKQRFHELPAIAAAYRQQIDGLLNIVEGHLITALPLEPQLKEQLKECFAKLYGKPLWLTEELDPKLLAGGILRVKDQQVDFSAKGKLTQLKKQLLSKKI